MKTQVKSKLPTLIPIGAQTTHSNGNLITDRSTDANKPSSQTEQKQTPS